MGSANRKTLKDRITEILRKEDDVLYAVPRRGTCENIFDEEESEDEVLETLFAMNEADARREVFAEISSNEKKGEVIE